MFDCRGGAEGGARVWQERRARGKVVSHHLQEEHWGGHEGRHEGRHGIWRRPHAVQAAAKLNDTGNTDRSASQQSQLRAP